MRILTAVRLLAGAALVSACAVVPSWLVPSSAPESPILVRAPRWAAPYEDEDPLQIRLRSGALLTYDGTDLAPGRATAWEKEFTWSFAASGEPLQRLESLKSPGLSFRKLESGGVQIRLSEPPEDWTSLRKAVQEACGWDLDPAKAEVVRWPRVEARYRLEIRSGSELPDRTPVPSGSQTPAQTVLGYFSAGAMRLPGVVSPIEILDDRHLLVRTRRPDADFARRLTEPCPGVFSNVTVEQVLSLRPLRPGGDPAVALDVRNSRGILLRRAAQRLAGEMRIEAHATGVGLISPRLSYSLLEACAAPLGETSWELHGWQVRQPDPIEDVEAALREGRVSAAFLIDPPGEFAFRDFGLRVIVGAVLNAALPVSQRTEIIEAAKGMRPRLPALNLRILCRRSDRASREEALAAAEKLRRAGARPCVEAETDERFASRLHRREFDLALAGFPTTVYAEPRRWWRSTSPLNLSGVANPELDRKLDRLDETFDPRERELLRSEISQRLAQLSVWWVIRYAPVRLCGRPEALRRLIVD